MRLKLGDVLDHREFGLELCSGGDAARAAPVDGAHSIDLRDAAPWLQEGWVMLTTGLQIRDDPAAQRRLVTDLAEARITALALGLGIVINDVPPALLEEARRREFPVLTVPLETPFRQIESFVHGAYLSEDLYVLRRQTSMQRYLLDAVRQGRPEQSLVERLGSLLGGADVAYLDASGTSVATTTPGVDWSEAAPDLRRPNVCEFEHHGRWGVAAPVMEEHRPTGWLVALLPPATVPRQVARPVVRTAGELLGLVSVARLAGAQGRQARRRRLGSRVLRAATGLRDEGLASALAAEGIDFTRPCHVALLSPPPGKRAADGLQDALERELEAAGVEATVAVDGAGALVLAQDDLSRLAAWLADEPALGGLRAGVSRPFAQLEDLSAAAGEARLALLAAGAAGRGTRVQRHDALEPAVTLLGVPGAEPVLERLRAVLALLDDEPRLRAAVVAYLEAGLDIGQTARALGLHRNSIRYRLGRAEDLLGRSLRDPAAIATIHLALLAERLAAGRGDAAHVRAQQC